MKSAFSEITLDHFKVKKRSNLRNEVIKEIYQLYSSEKERTIRRIENWKNYIKYLKANKIRDTKERQQEFKKYKIFIKEKTDKQLAIYLSIIPTESLYYMLSVSRDKYKRGESVGKYVMGSIKPK